MVRTSKYKFKAFYGHIDGLEEGFDDIFVVLGAKVDELDGSFEVVEEAMDVGEEDLDCTASAKEMCELQDRNEVAAMWSACCRGAYEVVNN